MNPSPFPPRYSSVLGRALIVKILLISGAIVSILSMVTSALEMVFPQVTGEEEFADNPGGIVVALMALGFGAITILVYVATVIFFLVWLYRCYKNLPAFGTPESRLSYSPGWAMGSFFVPFANLVIPYRSIKELWQRSVAVSSTYLEKTSVPAWFPLWWTFWLLSNIAGNIYFRLSFNEKASREAVAIVGIVSDALSIIAAIFAIVIVTAISERQEAAGRSLSLHEFPTPPLPPRAF